MRERKMTNHFKPLFLPFDRRKRRCGTAVNESYCFSCRNEHKYYFRHLNDKNLN